MNDLKAMSEVRRDVRMRNARNKELVGVHKRVSEVINESLMMPHKKNERNRIVEKVFGSQLTRVRRLGRLRKR